MLCKSKELPCCHHWCYQSLIPLKLSCWSTEVLTAARLLLPEPEQVDTMLPTVLLSAATALLGTLYLSRTSRAHSSAEEAPNTGVSGIFLFPTFHYHFSVSHWKKLTRSQLGKGILRNAVCRFLASYDGGGGSKEGGNVTELQLDVRTTCYVFLDGWEISPFGRTVQTSTD